MNGARLQESLSQFAAQSGVVGCALVEPDTGMVWASAGDMPGVQAIGEAVADHWRLFHRRRSDFDALGDLRAQVMIHARRRVTLVACGDRLVLVTVSEEPDQVNWTGWKLRLGSLAAVVDSL